MHSSRPLLALLLLAFCLPVRGESLPSYEALESTPVDSPNYRLAFLELQKIHYGTKQWDKFFGYAAFYRKHLMTTPNAEQTQALLLESLALTKHCQYPAAQKVLDQAKASSQLADQNGLVQKVSAVQDLLDLQAKLGGYVRTSASAKPFDAFTNTSHWRIHEANRGAVVERAIKNPRALRVVVKDLCVTATGKVKQ